MYFGVRVQDFKCTHTHTQCIDEKVAIMKYKKKIGTSKWSSNKQTGKQNLNELARECNGKKNPSHIDHVVFVFSLVRKMYALCGG